MNYFQTIVRPNLDQWLTEIFWRDRESLLAVNYLVVKVDSLHALDLMPSEWTFCADKPTKKAEHFLLTRARGLLLDSIDYTIIPTLFFKKKIVETFISCPLTRCRSRWERPLDRVLHQERGEKFERTNSSILTSPRGTVLQQFSTVKNYWNRCTCRWWT